MHATFSLRHAHIYVHRHTHTHTVQTSTCNLAEHYNPFRPMLQALYILEYELEKQAWQKKKNYIHQNRVI